MYFTTLDMLDKHNSYPPYNIIKVDDDNFIVEIAAAGRTKDSFEVSQHEGILTVKGDALPEPKGKYQTQRISNKSFVQEYSLGEYIDVEKVKYDNGLLVIELKRNIPEAKRPKVFAIEAS